MRAWRRASAGDRPARILSSMWSWRWLSSSAVVSDEARSPAKRPANRFRKARSIRILSTLFRAQGPHWVQLRGAPRGQQTSTDRGEQQRGNHDCEDRPVVRTGVVEHGTDEVRGGGTGKQSQREAQQRGAEAVEKNHPQHVLSTGAESDAHADFRCPLRNQIREHTVESDCSQQKRQARKGDRKRCAEA